jgi:alkanesulfonate monooxygenase SsuD/methylene tetrahydromethanopterin reductase-like flavin-dependent oxidoreductase (luciferase family)
MEAMGNLDMDRNAMFVEAIDQILAIWAGEPPYDIEGKYWKVSTRRTLIEAAGQGVFVKPFQKPHPPIVVTAIAPASRGLAEAAARGWAPISANFLQPNGVATHWPKIVEGHARSGRGADWREWRVAKSVFVADDAQTARRYARDVNGA